MYKLPVVVAPNKNPMDWPVMVKSTSMEYFVGDKEFKACVLKEYVVISNRARQRIQEDTLNVLLRINVFMLKGF